MSMKENMAVQGTRGAQPWSILSRATLLVTIIVAAVALFPLLILVGTVLTSSASVLRALGQQETLIPLWHTAEVSVIATLLALIIGSVSALVVGSIAPRMKRWWQLLALLPLFVPPFVGAFSWLQAYARGGLSDEVTHVTFPWLYGPVGIIVLLAVHSAPLAYLTLSATLARLDHRPVEAARLHGASRWDAFVSVTWPTLRPTMIAAAGLIFALDAGDFGIPLVLGTPGQFLTATTQIYQQLSFAGTPESFSIAMALSLILALGSLLILVALQRLETGHTLVTYAVGARARQVREGKALHWLAQAGLVCYTLIVTILPFVALVLTSLTRSYGLPPLPQNWTLEHLAAIFEEDTATAIEHSLLLSAATALVIIILGMIGAEWSARSRFGRLLTRLVWLPYAIPGSVIGVAVTIAYGKWLYGTLTIIFLAYLGKFWGLAEPMTSMRSQIEMSCVRAGRTFGARPLLAYLIGIWPQMQAAALAIGVLVLVNSIYELTMSSLLFAPGTETLAIVVLNAEEGGDVATTATIGVLLTLLMIVSLLILTAGEQRHKRAKGTFPSSPAGALEKHKEQGGPV